MCGVRRGRVAGTIAAISTGGVLMVLDARDFAHEPPTDTADVVATFGGLAGVAIWIALRWGGHHPDRPAHSRRGGGRRHRGSRHRRRERGVRPIRELSGATRTPSILARRGRCRSSLSRTGSLRGPMVRRDACLSAAARRAAARDTPREPLDREGAP
jgi:hypothetical protein